MKLIQNNKLIPLEIDDIRFFFFVFVNCYNINTMIELYRPGFHFGWLEEIYLLSG